MVANQGCIMYVYMKHTRSIEDFYFYLFLEIPNVDLKMIKKINPCKMASISFSKRTDYNKDDSNRTYFEILPVVCIFTSSLYIYP